MEVSSPTIIVERAGSHAWTHKSWRVREEFARTVASAIGLFSSTELPLQRAILPPEMYTHAGAQFRDELQRHHVPTAMVRDINLRLERIEPKVRSSDGLPKNYAASEKPASTNSKKKQSKPKFPNREASLFGGMPFVKLFVKGAFGRFRIMCGGVYSGLFKLVMLRPTGNAVLRARCCEYALLILEYWADAPEIQRSSSAFAAKEACYRMFSKTWPERSRRLYMAFDPVIQRIINEEDGSMHRRQPSPSVRERGSHTPFSSQMSASANVPGYSTSAIVAMDRTASLPSVGSVSSGLLLSQAKSGGKGSERTLESVLHSSKEKVSAIESMLRGLDVKRSSSLDLGVDPPSSRDPPFPLAAPASTSLTRSLGLDTSSGMLKRHDRNGGLMMSDIITQIQASKDSGKLSYRSGMGGEPTLALSSYFSGKERNTDRVLRGDILKRILVGLSSSSDWNARVAAFNYVRSSLELGPRGVQEIIQSFEKVMKLFFQHLDDPHHKVAQAALSTLADLIPACKKPFESYMERILPHVFSRLIDPKEVSTSVLNFILTLSVEEQNSLRRTLKQYTPRIEVDLMNFLQSKKDKQRSKSYDPFDIVGELSSEEHIQECQRKINYMEGILVVQWMIVTAAEKWSSLQENGSSTAISSFKAKDVKHGLDNMESASSPRLDMNGMNGSEHQEVTTSLVDENEPFQDSSLIHPKLAALRINSPSETGPSIPQILHLKEAMEESVEIVIEKLLHVTKDTVSKVANEAEHCVTLVLSQYDPLRCLNCQACVVFCLVDIYIMLGKAFLPYLGGLNSTQLRLVTIYANRISQARTGTPIDASHD
ncbi:hypothetical protein Leryth_026736 [Lithospermum erythrorhizon]|nr:hypothetical protein Leryth_026736 [Lithospermum erythrorhizon]